MEAVVDEPLRAMELRSPGLESHRVGIVPLRHTIHRWSYHSAGVGLVGAEVVVGTVSPGKLIQAVSSPTS